MVVNQNSLALLLFVLFVHLGSNGTFSLYFSLSLVEDLAEQNQFISPTLGQQLSHQASDYLFVFVYVIFASWQFFKTKLKLFRYFIKVDVKVIV